MNTKSAVILMIGLLGMPAVFNFTTPLASPGQRWTVVPVDAGNTPTHMIKPRAVLLDNQTGATRMITDDLIGEEGKKIPSAMQIRLSNTVSPGR